MADRAAPSRCPQWAMRIYDAMAAVMLVIAGFSLATGGGAPEPAAAGFDRDWADLWLAAMFPAMLLFSLWLGRRKRLRDYDEYLARLIGHAAGIGVMTTVLAWSSWTILAQSWVAPPTAEQLIGVLIGSSALGYAVARLRDSF